ARSCARGRHRRRRRLGRGEVLSAEPAFEIEVTSQHWITDRPDSVRHDLCSHGNLRLVIGGTVILPRDDQREYTISASALALLRTLESDHSRSLPVAGELILHCGALFMSSCPIGVDWSVSHADGVVRLGEVVRVDEIGGGEIRFPDVAAELT